MYASAADYLARSKSSLVPLLLLLLVFSYASGDLCVYLVKPSSCASAPATRWKHPPTAAGFFPWRWPCVGCANRRRIESPPLVRLAAALAERPSPSTLMIPLEGASPLNLCPALPHDACLRCATECATLCYPGAPAGKAWGWNTRNEPANLVARLMVGPNDERS